MKTLDWRVEMLGHGTITVLSYVQKRLKTRVASNYVWDTFLYIYTEKNLKPLARRLFN